MNGSEQIRTIGRFIGAAGLGGLVLIACGPMEDSDELDEASTYDALSVEAVLGAYPDPFNPLSSTCPGITATPQITLTSDWDKFSVSVNDPNPTLHKDTIIYFKEQFSPASGDRLTHPRNRVRKLVGPKADGTGGMGVMGLRGRRFEVYVARRCNDTRTRSTLSPVAIADLTRGGTVAPISRATRTPIVMAPGSSMSTALRDTTVSGSSYPCFRECGTNGADARVTNAARLAVYRQNGTDSASIDAQASRYYFDADKEFRHVRFEWSTNNGSTWSGVDVQERVFGPAIEPTVPATYILRNLSYGAKLLWRAKSYGSTEAMFTDSAYTPQQTFWICPATASAPSASSITASSALISWAAETGVSRYRVGYRVRGSSSWTSGGETTGTNLTLSGLLAATEYEFRISSSCNGSPYDGVGTEAGHTGAWRFTTLAGSTGPVCGDGMCSRGEIDTCPADCGSTPPPPAPLCGDGVCDALNGESSTSCPTDCGRSCGTNRICFE